jgi:prophage DNA circulation protein
VHQYPFRDTPWPEDIGKAARRFQVTGFLVENDAITGGGDVIAQRDSMISVVEAPGPLTLVHPTLGQMSVSVLEAAFTEKWDAGRYFEVDFSFIEGGQRLFPTANVNTGNAVGSSATSADSAASSDFSMAAATISA